MRRRIPRSVRRRIQNYSFRIHDTDFEPNDRLVFSEGHVDPLETADFKFFITDFTPKLEFYLRQDPRIPLS